MREEIVEESSESGGQGVNKEGWRNEEERMGVWSFSQSSLVHKLVKFKCKYQVRKKVR